MTSATARALIELALPRPQPARQSAQIATFPAAAAAADGHLRQLMAIVRQRDTTAFIALFNHFAPRVKAFMKRLGASDELAEELTQDVMFTVWRKADSYDPAKSAVSSWIFTIARNLRIDALRRAQRREFDPTEPSLLPEPPPPPDADLLVEQQSRRVRAALAALAPEQAAVVGLAFYDGKTHGEIAAMLAIPLGTVKSRLRLAFQHIRHALAEGDAAAPTIPFFAAHAARRRPAAALIHA
jgi:RNA polymerase sigma-70 factor (ECF subfamily)